MTVVTVPRKVFRPDLNYLDLYCCGCGESVSVPDILKEQSVRMSSEKKSPAGFQGHLKARMIYGLLVLGPLFITLFILKLVFAALTAFVLPLIKGLALLNEGPNGVLVFIATLVSLLLIYLVGLFTSHFIGCRLILLGEKLMMKLPIVKSVYAASKQMMDTFSNSTKAAFSAMVQVTFPHPQSFDRICERRDE
jgi:hypothetical protein